MKFLITAGNTLTPIDQVRVITNVFTGRTGAAIALEAHRQGHQVSLLTSHPERVAEMAPKPPDPMRWAVFSYRTFDDLATLMEQRIPQGDFDVIVHCAAVSDYQAAGAFAPAQGTRFDIATNQWQASQTPPALLDRQAGKIKSDEAELWLRLVRTPKLVDKIRAPWGFGGMLVKFKLEVGISDERLLEIAERSRQQSNADLMVANTLEGAGEYAFLGPPYDRVTRAELAVRLMEAIVKRHAERKP